MFSSVSWGTNKSTYDTFTDVLQDYDCDMFSKCSLLCLVYTSVYTDDLLKQYNPKYVIIS